VRLLMQTALEAEVDAFLGRARYQRRTEEHRPGVRNGWQPPTAVKTTMGPVELQRPKLRGTDQAFCSRLFGAGVTAPTPWSRWSSRAGSGPVRPRHRAALAEVLGPEAALSRSTVSRICQRIKDEFQGWRTRDLSGVRLDYLFLDASHCKMHPGAPAEPVLAAWGIDVDGKPVFVGLQRRARSRPTPGTTSSPTWSAAGCARRCWASATALRGSPAPSSSTFAPRCGNGVWSTAPATPWPRCQCMTRPR
jgi:transposase-like protein